MVSEVARSLTTADAGSVITLRFDRYATLQAPGIHQDLVQLLLKLLAIGQAGQEVVLGHAQQAVFCFMAQVRIALDGGE